MNKNKIYIILIIVICLIAVYFFVMQLNIFGGDGNDLKNIQSINNVKKTVKNNKEISHLISPSEFKKKLESGEYILVDIRTLQEDKKERIPGTTFVIDFYKNDFEQRVSELDRNKKYLYYCRTGHRSGQASKLAQKFQFTEAYELDGGFVAWKKAGYETIK